jgi:hypothetical protein
MNPSLPFALIAIGLAACTTEPAANQAPSASIVSPGAGAQVTAGWGVALEGQVGDPDTVPETLSVTWIADGAPACEGLTPLPNGSTFCTWVAELEGGAIELLVTDPDGLEASASLEIQVLAPNAEPSCAITGPDSGSTYGPTDSFTLSGTASDPDGDSLQAVVSSSIDKELAGTAVGDDGSIELELGPLSLGEHTLTMTVTDPAGASCTAEVDVVIDTVDTGPFDPETGDPDLDPDTGGSESE